MINRFLLINNKDFFDKNNVVTVTRGEDIPDKDAILFIGSHERSLDNTFYVTRFFDYIKKKKYNYIIIVGKGDGMLPSNVIIPPNIKYIYCCNVDYEHSIIKFIPMGSDFRSINSFKYSDINNKERKILCYCNFSINTHPIRQRVYDLVKNKNFMEIEHMGNFLDYNISRDTFFKKISNSKFVLCPRGNANDTFRFYDTIYAGAIPIVVKKEYHKLPYFEDVPILYLENENQYGDLTEELLNYEYDRLSLKKGSYNNLDMGIFLEKLHTLLQ